MSKPKEETWWALINDETGEISPTKILTNELKDDDPIKEWCKGRWIVFSNRKKMSTVIKENPGFTPVKVKLVLAKKHK